MRVPFEAFTPRRPSEGINHDHRAANLVLEVCILLLHLCLQMTASYCLSHYLTQLGMFPTLDAVPDCGSSLNLALTPLLSFAKIRPSAGLSSSRTKSVSVKRLYSMLKLCTSEDCPACSALGSCRHSGIPRCHLRNPSAVLGPGVGGQQSSLCYIQER